MMFITPSMVTSQVVQDLKSTTMLQPIQDFTDQVILELSANTATAITRKANGIEFKKSMILQLTQ